MQELASSRPVVIGALVALVLSLGFISWRVLGGRKALAPAPAAGAAQIVNPAEEYNIPRGPAAGMGTPVGAPQQQGGYQPYGR